LAGTPDTYKDCRSPVVNKSSSLDLFQYLRANKVGADLEQVVIYVGDYGRDHGGMLRYPDFGEGYEERFECNAPDGTGNGEVGKESWCTGNHRLQVH